MLIGPMTKRRSNAKTAYGLMTDIRAYILEEPKRIFMGDWIIKGEALIEDVLETEAPACGTVGCIAGNAELLTDGQIDYGSAHEVMSGRDAELQSALYSLFLDTEVAAPYGTKKYARIVAQRITKFQARYKEKLQRVRLAD